jgi:hypothetical protein
MFPITLSHWMFNMAAKIAKLSVPPQFLAGIFEELCIPDVAHHLGEGYAV